MKKQKRTLIAKLISERETAKAMIRTCLNEAEFDAAKCQTWQEAYQAATKVLRKMGIPLNS